MIVSLAQLAAQENSKLEIVGETHVISTSNPVTGQATGSSIQAARTGKDFHIRVGGLPDSDTVQMELGFAELDTIAPGTRVFNVYVNDKPALVDFDILREAKGPFKSIIRKFSITPNNGNIDFHFSATAGEAAINFIRITAPGVNRLIAPPTTVSIGHTADPDEFRVPPDQQATFNVEEATIHVDDTLQTWNSGVPIGGIGTGKFEILPNGQFANFTINNSWDLPVLRPPGTFLAVAAKATSRGGTSRLLQVNPADAEGKKLASDYRPMEEAEFQGQLPFASWDFKDQKFPLAVTVNAWSPVTPGNLADSSLPGGMINVILRNPNNYPVSTAVAFSWEDLNGRGGSLLPGDQHGFNGRSTHQDAATSAVTGIQISSDYNLQNREATFTGNYFVGTPIKGAVITRKLNWNPRSGNISWWKQFSSRLRLDRIPSTPAVIDSDPKGGPTASTICVSFNLAPKEIRRVPFIVSWYIPQIVTMDSTQGTPSTEVPDYVSRFGSSAGVASYLASNRVEMRKASDEWFDMVNRATVPAWLKAHVLNSLFPLKTNSILLKNQRFAMLESPADMRGMLGPIDLRLTGGDFLRSLFPDLEKTELNLYARAQDASGRIPRYVGNIHGALAGFDAKLLGNDWIDPSACWLLQMAAYWRESNDQAFVDSTRPAISKARDYLLQSLKDGKVDSTPNAYSIVDGYPSAGKASLVDVLAGIRAAQALLGENNPEIAQLINQQADHLQLSNTTSTYAAMLIGEHALHDAALPGLFSLAQNSEYLKKIHDHNYATKPVPLMEATADGVIPEGANSFPITLQSSVGAFALNLGLPDVGLEAFVRMFQVAYAAQKNPWKQALRYDVPTGARGNLRYHRSAMGAWSIWRSLSGVVHDVPNKRLYLDPHILDNPAVDLEIPVFTPAFWGWLKYNQVESTGTLAITRVSPAFTSSTITSVATRLNPDGTPEHLVNLPEPFMLEEGATLELEGWPAKAGATVMAQKPEVAQPQPATTSTLSLNNEASTITEAGIKSPEPSKEKTSRESEEGEEMPPTPEEEEPMPKVKQEEE